MAAEAIANFDNYVWVAVGLFIAGLFGVMVYERETSGTKRHQQPPGSSSANPEK